MAAGKGKGQILQNGQVLFTVAESDIVETLVHFATEMATRSARNAARVRPW